MVVGNTGYFVNSVIHLTETKKATSGACTQHIPAPLFDLLKLYRNRQLIQEYKVGSKCMSACTYLGRYDLMYIQQYLVC